MENPGIGMFSVTALPMWTAPMVVSTTLLVDIRNMDMQHEWMH